MDGLGSLLLGVDVTAAIGFESKVLVLALGKTGGKVCCAVGDVKLAEFVVVGADEEDTIAALPGVEGFSMEGLSALLTLAISAS